jgi:AhpD family alkylhydroperoxidase
MRFARIIPVITGALLAITAVSVAQTEAEATYQDMQKTIGFVPGFFKAFPEEGIAGAWDEMKSFQMNPNTALPAKTKELIGAAVAAQIPCRYCSYFHQQVAKADGGTDQELKEAIALSALTRHWSTVLNGMQVELPTFQQEVSKIMQHASQGGSRGTTQQPAQGSNAQQQQIAVTDAVSAYKDMQNTLGIVPMFMRRFPEAGIAGAWREFKALELSTTTALDAKTKDLIGLAVAAQIPCTYCIYFHTEGARHNGATTAEISEAVGMAAITRHWSTVLNGSLVDENAFRKDVDRLVKNMRARSARATK